MRLLQKTIIGVSLAVLAGCGGIAEQQTPEERVADRAQERRMAMIDGDFEKAYEYLSPGYRANTSLNAWKGRFGGAVNWTDAEVRSVECEDDDACTATVLLSYRVSMPQGGDREGRRPFDEQWVRSEGEWWHLPRR